MDGIEEEKKSTSKILNKGRKQMKGKKQGKKKLEIKEDVAEEKQPSGDTPKDDSVGDSNEEATEEELLKGPELFLTPLQVKDIQLFEARRQMQDQVMINLQQEMTLINNEYKNKQMHIKAKMQSTKESQRLIKAEHLAFVAGIEQDLGIKLADYTYNEMGRLTYNPIEPSVENTEDIPPIENGG